MSVRAGQTGTVEYTGRAFHQDAQEAMGGDVVRALIELITNSDDAYVAAGGRGVGRILVELDRRQGQDWTLTVRDRAIGMSAQDMIEKITRLGGRTSGFERGEERRGNLGRGAKDVAAFGDAVFESIHDGRYARLLLRSDGTYVLEEARRATDQDRSTLGVPRGNGTSVTVRVRAGTRCPRHATLKARLSAHFQLRDILSDPSRRVELHTVNSGAQDLLTYQYPDLAVEFEGDVTIPNYDATGRLTIWRHDSRYDAGPEDPTRPIGILIKGRRAIYDNTLFGFEGNPHAGWFSGKLVCPTIDVLAREYDDRLTRGIEPDASNPVPVISRRRQGLSGSHPFTRAIRAAVEEHLRPLVEREAARAEEQGSQLGDEHARAALERLAREISQLVADELREIEAEELPGADPGAVPPIAVVPEMAYAYLGEDRTLSVMVRGDVAVMGDTAEAAVEPLGVVEILTPQIVLASHPRRTDLLVGQMRLRPLTPDDSCIVTASVNGRSGEAIVEVREARIIDDEPVVPPDTLEFERPSYRVSWHREKPLTLRAPARIVATDGARATVASSDPGVIVRTPSVDLHLDEELEFYRATVRVEGRTLASSAVVTARVGDSVATARVSVVRREEGARFRIDVVDEEMGVYRALRELEVDSVSGDEIQVIKVYARHPALRRVLSEHANSLSAEPVMLVVAEAVADVTARFVVSRLYQLRRAAEEFTADRLFLEYYRRVTRFLPRYQSVLRVPGALQLMSGRDNQDAGLATDRPSSMSSAGQDTVSGANLPTDPRT